MRTRFVTLISAGATLVALTASAKQTEPTPAVAPPAPTISGVTVNGHKPNSLVDPTTQFVKERIPESAWSEQLARYHDPVCVRVQGLPPEFSGFIAKRIVEVATEVGAPVDKAEGCRPNVNVVFTTQPQALISDVAKRRDTLLGAFFQAQFKKLSTFDRPIQSWYATKVIDDKGGVWTEVKTTCPWDSSIPQCDRAHGRAGSRLSNGMSAEIAHSLVIADANKVAGEKIDAVADYIAVLSLARWTGLEKCARVPTVLNLLADDCADAPQAATPQDLALLTALYKVNPRELGLQQRATVASAVRKATKDAETAH